MRSELDSGEDSRRTVRTADNTQCTGFLRREAHHYGTQQYGKDTKLRSRTEYGKTQIAEHRSEVRQRTHTHKDDRRQKSGLYQHIVDEVHQSEVVCNLVQRHFPDVLQHSVHHYHAVFICLDNPHVATGEIGNEHTESNGNQQQRFVMLPDAQIQQNKGNDIHYKERRIGNNIAERRHIIEFRKYIFHHPIFINTSSSETESPGLTQIAVTVPLKSARMAL